MLVSKDTCVRVKNRQGKSNPMNICVLLADITLRCQPVLSVMKEFLDWNRSIE